MNLEKIMQYQSFFPARGDMSSKLVFVDDINANMIVKVYASQDDCIAEQKIPNDDGGGFYRTLRYDSYRNDKLTFSVTLDAEDFVTLGNYVDVDDEDIVNYLKDEGLSFRTKKEYMAVVEPQN